MPYVTALIRRLEGCVRPVWLWDRQLPVSLWNVRVRASGGCCDNTASEVYFARGLGSEYFILLLTGLLTAYLNTNEVYAVDSA